MTKKEKALKEFEKWYKNLPEYRSSGGPAKGTIAGALVVLERLKDNFKLDIEAHTAKGGSQITGTSGGAVKSILERFGEKRPFVSEGGRTNRGLRGDISKMFDSIKELEIINLSKKERNEVLETLQAFLIDRVREYHNRQRLILYYDPLKTTWQLIRDFLDSARLAGKEGPVVQYLVGAKLQIRFPDLNIRNASFSTADDQLGQQGDFLVENTVFHITTSPMKGIYEKCVRNLKEGLRVFLLVPHRILEGSRQNAEEIAPGKIAVEAIESFVGQNVEELSIFSGDRIKIGILRLLETYNQRVVAVELDKSMLIEIPENIRN